MSIGEQLPQAGTEGGKQEGLEALAAKLYAQDTRLATELERAREIEARIAFLSAEKQVWQEIEQGKGGESLEDFYLQRLAAEWQKVMKGSGLREQSALAGLEQEAQALVQSGLIALDFYQQGQAEAQKKEALAKSRQFYEQAVLRSGRVEDFTRGAEGIALDAAELWQEPELALAAYQPELSAYTEAYADFCLARRDWDGLEQALAAVGRYVDPRQVDFWRREVALQRLAAEQELFYELSWAQAGHDEERLLEQVYVNGGQDDQVFYEGALFYARQQLREKEAVQVGQALAFLAEVGDLVRENALSREALLRILAGYSQQDPVFAGLLQQAVAGFFLAPAQSKVGCYVALADGLREGVLGIGEVLEAFGQGYLAAADCLALCQSMGQRLRGEQDVAGEQADRYWLGLLESAARAGSSQADLKRAQEVKFFVLQRLAAEQVHGWQRAQLAAEMLKEQLGWLVKLGKFAPEVGSLGVRNRSFLPEQELAGAGQ